MMQDIESGLTGLSTLILIGYMSTQMQTLP